ncbi:hypothetical protein [Acidithrix sp. C25]|nr:hypothetical protein [Acidithrix sp. C25]
MDHAECGTTREVVNHGTAAHQRYFQEITSTDLTVTGNEDGDKDEFDE